MGTPGRSRRSFIPFSGLPHRIVMSSVKHLIDLEQPSLWIAVGSVFFNPLFWNIVARQEFKNKILTRLAGGNPYYGCYGLATTIFSLGILRDHLYQLALQDQPTHPFFDEPWVQPVAIALFAAGSVLVLTSMWALGVTGTYLGDYFGILMDEKVESFPFNVTDDPMYWGSTMNFIATAMWYNSPAGIAISALVYVVYKIALTFEGPFTSGIYAAREKKREQERNGIVAENADDPSSHTRRKSARLN